MDRPKCYSYLRVSTRGQAESGVGEASQREAAARVYDRIRDRFDWGGEMFDPAECRAEEFGRRPKGMELKLRLRRGDAVILPKLDRAFGSIFDMFATLDGWRREGVRVLSPDFNGEFLDTDSIAGVAMVGALGIAAQISHMHITARNREKVAASKATGRCVGTPPWGFKKVRWRGKAYLQPNEREREVSQWFLRLRQQGVKFPEIEELCRRHRVRNRRGKPWVKQTILTALRREKELQKLERRLRPQPGHFVSPYGVVLQIFNWAPDPADTAGLDTAGREDIVDLTPAEEPQEPGGAPPAEGVGV